METDSSIWPSPEDRARLEGWVAGRDTPQKLVWRARIVLMWAQGTGVTAVVRATGKTKRTAYRWRDRYLACGVSGLERDATRPGRKSPLDAATIERVVEMTLVAKPARRLWPEKPAGSHAGSGDALGADVAMSIDGSEDGAGFDARNGKPPLLDGEGYSLTR